MSEYIYKSPDPPDEIGEQLELLQNEPDELKRFIVGIALYHPDGARVELACRSYVGHDDEEVRGNAILAFGHLARRFRVLSPDIKPLIESALLDDSAHVKGQAWAAASDVRFFLGWNVKGFKKDEDL